MGRARPIHSPRFYDITLVIVVRKLQSSLFKSKISYIFMTKTTRIVCLCILGAVGTLCGVSTINAPITEDKTELITPTEPLRSAYIVADIAMQDPVAISLQGEIYALERRTLTEYNGDNTLFTARADVLRLDEDLQTRQMEIYPSCDGYCFRYP